MFSLLWTCARTTKNNFVSLRSTGYTCTTVLYVNVHGSLQLQGTANPVGETPTFFNCCGASDTYHDCLAFLFEKCRALKSSAGFPLSWEIFAVFFQSFCGDKQKEKQDMQTGFII